MNKTEMSFSWRISLPEGALAWDQVLEYPHHFVPWPYTPEEFVAIAEFLTGPNQENAMSMVMWASRLFVCRASKWLSTPDKPNTGRELANIQALILRLQKAIKAASPLTHNHLAAMMRSNIVREGERPCSLHDLLYALDCFEIHNRPALNEPPPVAKGGPRTRYHEKEFFKWIKLAFDRCNPGAGGYYKFELACAAPLQGPGLFPPVDAKAWQKKRKPQAATTRKKAPS
jgi:hypothetical protein